MIAKPDFTQKFNEVQQKYREIKDDVESKVTSWFWATNSLFSAEPFYFEEHRFKKGRRLKEEPTDKSNKYHYGMNAAKEIIVERQYTSLKREEYRDWCYETFYQRNNEEVVACHYDYDPEKSLINFSTFSYSGGLLINLVQVFEVGWNDQQFEYAAERLTRKTVNQVTGKDQLSAERIFKYEYDAVGRLSSIEEASYSWYKLSDDKISYKDMTVLAEEPLFKVLRDTIRASVPEEEVYCLFINYGSEHLFPPSIAFGKEEERKRWQEEEGKNAKWLIWNPADYSINIDELKIDKETVDFFELYNQETEMKEKYNAAIKAILNVTIKLKAHLDEFNLHKTADFVIVAGHYDASDLKKNCKMINPELGAEFLRQLP